MTGGTASVRAVGHRAGAAVRAVGRCAASVVGAAAGLVLCALELAVGSLVGIGIGLVLLPPVVRTVQRLTTRQRLRAAAVGVEIPVPYDLRPAPAGRHERAMRLLADRANLRDTAWLAVDGTLGVLLTAVPVALALHGLLGVLVPVAVPTGVVDVLGGRYAGLPVDGPVTAGFALLLGLGQVGLALWLAPRALLLHARLSATLLSPSEVTLLADRVAHLAETREDVMGSQIDELRRIERNLHDGAQARLVAMGMTLDAAMQMITKDPEAARALVDEAKTSSARALQEIRDLVRGVQPPVLVDRGLVDAVRTLAIESPLRVETDLELAHRPSPVVESAAYFIVSELLANMVKHSGASGGTVVLRHRDGKLVATVHDDGRGGADPARGSGLRGVARRLAPLDGTLTVVSPQGGPTDVSVEIPCRPDAGAAARD